MDIPDTTSGLILGYSIAGVVIALYLVSMVARFRNVQRDRDVVEKLSEDSE